MCVEAHHQLRSFRIFFFLPVPSVGVFSDGAVEVGHTLAITSGITFGKVLWKKTRKQHLNRREGPALSMPRSTHSRKSSAPPNRDSQVRRGLH